MGDGEHFQDGVKIIVIGHGNVAGVIGKQLFDTINHKAGLGLVVVDIPEKRPDDDLVERLLNLIGESKRDYYAEAFMPTMPDPSLLYNNRDKFVPKAHKLIVRKNHKHQRV